MRFRISTLLILAATLNLGMYGQICSGPSATHLGRDGGLASLSNISNSSDSAVSQNPASPNSNEMYCYPPEIFLTRQGSFRPCFVRSTESRFDVIKRLGTEFHIYLADSRVDHPVFTNAFLTYLYQYALVTQLRSAISEPILLEANLTESGPLLVRKMCSDGFASLPVTCLLFNRNANERILNTAIAQAATNPATQTHVPGSSVTNYRVDYNNTLFEQLTWILISDHHLAELIERHYGLRLAPPSAERFRYPTQEFRHRELLLIAKTLLDLPESIRRLWRLNGIYRLRSDYSLRQNRVAEYSNENRIIVLSERAFALEAGDTMGEKSLAHEIGHAVWEGILSLNKLNYIRLSWLPGPSADARNLENAVDEASAWIISPEHRQQFLTDYSKTDIFEDFAEHFAGYFYAIERLPELCAEKFRFLRDQIFGGTVYHAEAHERAQIYVRSTNPDVNPPRLNASIERSVSVNVLPASTGSYLRARIEGVADDESGVLSIELTFKHRSLPNSPLVNVPIGSYHLIDAARGVYQMDYFLSENEYSGGDYDLSYISIRDRVGSTFHQAVPTAQGRTRFTLPGNRVVVRQEGGLSRENQIPNYAWNHVRLNELPHPTSQNAVYSLELPVPPQTRSIQTLFRSTSSSSTGSVDCNATCLASAVRLPNGARRFRFAFPAALPAQDYRLLNVLATDEDYTQRMSHAPDNRNDLVLHWAPPLPGTASFGFDVNQLNTTVAYGTRNSNGGNVQVRVVLPIEIAETISQTEGHVSLRGPNGTSITGSFDTSDIHMVNGRRMLSAKVELPAHHLQGIYTIDYIRIEGRPRFSAGQAVRGVVQAEVSISSEIQLLQRGIRTNIELALPNGERAQ